MGALLLLIIVFLFILWWLFEFILLMSLEDHLFPGKSDKCIWGILFIILPFIAPLAFALYRFKPMEKKDKLVKQIKEEIKYD